MNTLASFFNLGGPDGLLIFLIVLLLFGAKRLPELAKGLGSAVREFSKAKDDIQHEITRPSAPQIQPPPNTYPHDATGATTATPQAATPPASTTEEDHHREGNPPV